jgi:hypothetical protein
MDQTTDRMIPRVDDQGNRALPNLQILGQRKEEPQVGDSQAHL